MVTGDDKDENQWWPDKSQWPDYEPRYSNIAPALALLIIEGTIMPYPNGDSDGPRLAVNCNDLFYWGTADCEPVTACYGSRDELDFWRLYEMTRTMDNGSDVWCCFQRGMRPQTPIEKKWREAGLWTDELEALEPRDPKDCG